MDSKVKHLQSTIPFTSAGLLTGSLYFVASAPLVPSLLLFPILLALAIYDFRSFRLPNLLTAALFLFGLFYLYLGARWPLEHHLSGAFIGLLFFPSLNLVYKKLRGRDGIGLGDTKFLTGIGLWLGWQALPVVLLIASTSGILYAFFSARADKQLSATLRLPFGSFLSLGTWVAWLFF